MNERFIINGLNETIDASFFFFFFYIFSHPNGIPGLGNYADKYNQFDVIALTS